MHSLRDYISALKGCCALKFLHALQIDQALLTHTRTERESTQKNFNRENLKFGLEFSVWAPVTSGLVGVPSQHFFRATCREAGVIMGISFGRPTFWNLRGSAKKSPKFGAIFDNFRIWSPISVKRINVSQTWKVFDQRRLLPLWVRKIWWTLVHKCKRYGLILTHPSGHFSGDYISALGACGPSNFYMRYRLTESC